ncbi:hypothetical protein BaRGS_00029636 [Batillaria attramentaria]|uniref:Uncharacterized protein n=1 Tax=Batillaria attramentaria TaxID=370345 RepID=A0ABD0JW07_9CAEN
METDFATTDGGHNLYTKPVWIYLQQMQRLQQITQWFQRIHVLRRSDRYWAGFSLTSSRKVGQNIVTTMSEARVKEFKFRKDQAGNNGHEDMCKSGWWKTFKLALSFCFKRLVTAANNRPEDFQLASVLQYELSAPPPSLFESSGLTRAPNTATLRFTMVHARNDADLLTVQTAVKNCANTTIVTGEDTDLLVLLCFHEEHSYSDMHIIFRFDVKNRRQIVFDIKWTQTQLGRDLCRLLLFAHAVGGCGTTSRVYGVGKGSTGEEADRSCFQTAGGDLLQPAQRSQEDTHEGRGEGLCMPV